MKCDKCGALALPGDTVCAKCGNTLRISDNGGEKLKQVKYKGKGLSPKIIIGMFIASIIITMIVFVVISKVIK